MREAVVGLTLAGTNLSPPDRGFRYPDGHPVFLWPDNARPPARAGTGPDRDKREGSDMRRSEHGLYADRAGDGSKVLKVVRRR